MSGPKKLTASRLDLNAKRAQRGAKALRAWRGKESPDEADLSDLFADLMHYAGSKGYSFEYELRRARANYHAELDPHDDIENSEAEAIARARG